ncbi:MAG: hypothetical protein HY700_17955 [Gemmatimonadetes bacterium]|nr:hypothetical protein [Gemmatimonadota bacterium]
MDKVTLVPGSTQIDRNRINTTLYVQAANADVGADVLINGNATATGTNAHLSLLNDLGPLSAKVLSYPIYYYVTFAVTTGWLDKRRPVTVSVRNSDNKTSVNQLQFSFPQSTSTIDTDGDGLFDSEEPTVPVPSGIVLNTVRPDVLLQVDGMKDLAQFPDAEVFKTAHDAFAQAPVINWDGSTGINLVIDVYRDKIPWTQTVYLAQDQTNALASCTATADPVYMYYKDIKRVCFNNAAVARGKYYHYCIWVNDLAGTPIGISDVDFATRSVGDDCVIATETLGSSWQDVRPRAETLMHELGHQLGQRHGGVDDFVFNPSYNSVMSNSWTGRTAFLLGKSRLETPICQTAYYGISGVIEQPDGSIPSGQYVFAGYSRGMGRSIDPRHLDETTGICGIPIDWDCFGNAANCDGNANKPDFPKDLKGDGSFRKLDDYSNWGHLLFTGPRDNGTVVVVDLAGQPEP